MSPARIQRRRTRGWRMPQGAVYVGRPSVWGNPYRLSPCPDGWNVKAPWGGNTRFLTQGAARAWAVQSLRTDLEQGRAPWTEEEIRAHLAGHDLACWCPLDQPCHADLLLDIANTKEDER